MVSGFRDTFGSNFHVVSIRLFVNAQYLHFLLQIRMLVRLTPALGGDGTVCGIVFLNDTGSDFLMLATTLLGNVQGYTGHLQPSGILDANSMITYFPTILVQV